MSCGERCVKVNATGSGSARKKSCGQLCQHCVITVSLATTHTLREEKNSRTFGVDSARSEQKDGSSGEELHDLLICGAVRRRYSVRDLQSLR